MMSSTPPRPPTPMYVQVGFQVGSPGDATLQAVLGRDPKAVILSEAQHRRRHHSGSSLPRSDSRSGVTWRHESRARSR